MSSFVPTATELVSDREVFQRSLSAVETGWHETHRLQKKHFDLRSLLAGAGVNLDGLRAESVARLRVFHEQFLRHRLERCGVILDSFHAELEGGRRKLETLQEAGDNTLRQLDEHLCALRETQTQLKHLAPWFDAGNWRTAVPGELPPEPHAGLCEVHIEVERQQRRALLLSAWAEVAHRHNHTLHTVERLLAHWRELLDQLRAVENTLAVNTRELLGSAEQRSRELAQTGAASLAVTPPQLELSSRTVTLLRNQRLGPAETARLWDSFALTAAEQEALISRDHYALSGMSGLPVAVTSRAAELTLRRALEHPEEAYIALGFAGSAVSFAAFQKQLAQLRSQLEPNPNTQQRKTLVSLGKHRDSVTAVVAAGNLDTAEAVVVVVPGMFSSVGNIDTLVAAAENIQNSPKNVTPETTAVVAWMGYDSPGLAGELTMGHAEAGAAELARTLEHLGLPGTTAEGKRRWIAVVGHSYGSTVSAESLKLVQDATVDALFTVGSAGLETGTKREHLKVERIGATSADPHPAMKYVPLTGGGAMVHLASLLLTDSVAPVGRSVGTHRVDPRELRGAQRIENRGDGYSRPVRSHAITTKPHSGRPGYLDPGTAATNEIAEQLGQARDSKNSYR